MVVMGLLVLFYVGDCGWWMVIERCISRIGTGNFARWVLPLDFFCSVFWKSFFGMFRKSPIDPPDKNFRKRKSVFWAGNLLNFFRGRSIPSD